MIYCIKYMADYIINTNTCRIFVQTDFFLLYKSVEMCYNISNYLLLAAAVILRRYSHVDRY